MEVKRIDYSRISQLSALDHAYIDHDPRLHDFYVYEPEQDSIPDILKERPKFHAGRSLLFNVLKDQYESAGVSLPITEELLLDENTFTITTSHQPALFTGPLFHIYKIASIIHLAKKLNGRYPGSKFIPVFVISGEDHDWEEINHFYLFGKKYAWQRESSGPCGRLSTTGLQELVDSALQALQNEPFVDALKEILATALTNAKDYAQFHFFLLHALFHQHGLVLLNPDHADLKKAFTPIMEKEIRERFSYHHVVPLQGRLEKQGFKPQAFCRHVNLFYMTDERRERIDPQGEGFILHESQRRFSMDELLNELHDHPDRFSPNVILRPLYQEFILPNIIYVGGGGEIAYWLDRKTQFQQVDIHFPMLLRRNSLLMVDQGSLNQWVKLGFNEEDLVDDVNQLVRKFLRSHSHAELDFAKELEMFRNAFTGLAAKAEKLDPTLAKAILAEEIKQSKQFEQLSTRIVRAEKQLQDNQLKKIQKIKEKLFPGGGLQERHENFLGFYAAFGPKWIGDVISSCDPFIEKFILAQPAR